MLLTLISRDVFKHLIDFSVFDSCIENVPLKQLDEMSTIQANEEKFMEFMRFVHMQASASNYKEHGNKLIDKMWEVDKFKSYQNQSLHVLDHESIILDEDNAGIGIPQDINLKRKAIKDIDVTILYQALIDSNIVAAKNFLREHNLSDLFFIRGQAEESINFTVIDGSQFTEATLQKDKFNIL